MTTLLSVLSFRCFTTTTTTTAAAMKTRSNAPSFLLHHGPTVFLIGVLLNYLNTLEANAIHLLFLPDVIILICSMSATTKNFLLACSFIYINILIICCGVGFVVTYIHAFQGQRRCRSATLTLGF